MLRLLLPRSRPLRQRRLLSLQRPPLRLPKRHRALPKPRLRRHTRRDDRSVWARAIQRSHCRGLVPRHPLLEDSFRPACGRACRRVQRAGWPRRRAQGRGVACRAFCPSNHREHSHRVLLPSHSSSDLLAPSPLPRREAGGCARACPPSLRRHSKHSSTSRPRTSRWRSSGGSKAPGLACLQGGLPRPPLADSCPSLPLALAGARYRQCAAASRRFAAGSRRSRGAAAVGPSPPLPREVLRSPVALFPRLPRLQRRLERMCRRRRR
mmetsp:Transcript_18626/g.71863  ORF Transcript_18626/g.71863 Transcript_18626/m.71863 type:complete len:266 (+) Transcript_18626:321-1118(+)